MGATSGQGGRATKRGVWSRRGGVVTGMLRVSRHPAATVLLLAAMVMLVRSGVSSDACIEAAAPVGRSGGPDCGLAYVIRLPDGRFSLAPTGKAGAAPDAAGMVYYCYRSRSASGAPLGAIRESRLIEVTGGFTEKEIAEIYPLYIAYLDGQTSSYWRGVAATLKKGQGGLATRTVFRPVFLARAVVFVLLINSFAWVIPVAESIRQRIREGAFRPLSPQEKRWRSLWRGECPSCRYDIHNLPAMKCPECGETWAAHEATAWERRRAGRAS